MYQNYIFDFYGTLADIRTDEDRPYLWQKMSEIYSSLGAAYEPEELKRAFRELENREKENQYKRRASGEENGCCETEGVFRKGKDCAETEAEEILSEDVEPDLRKVFALLYEKKGVECSCLQAKMTAVTFRTLSREFVKVYDGVKDLLEELRRRGKGVYLLSNAQTDFTRPEIRMLGLEDYFDGIFISSEEGCKKPSPVFFHRLLKRYGLNPRECIMIGNDEESDIAGANQVGMSSLYIHTAISPKEYGKQKADYRVMDGDFRKIRDLVLKSQ